MTQRATGKGIVLQERDCVLLADLLDSRLMKLKHAAALHFEGSTEAAKKRIQRLKSAGMIAERPRRPNDPAVHHLGRAGYLALKDAGRIDAANDPGWAKLYKRQRTSDLMLRHELAVMDVKVALANAIRNDPKLELIELSTNPDRQKFRVVEAVPARSGGVRFRSLWVKPDGFAHFRVKLDDRATADSICYLEVDRGTEALGRIVEKLRRFRRHAARRDQRRRGGNNIPTSPRRDFRVVFLFESAERARNASRIGRTLAADSPSSAVCIQTHEFISGPLRGIFPPDAIRVAGRSRVRRPQGCQESGDR